MQFQRFLQVPARTHRRLQCQAFDHLLDITNFDHEHDLATVDQLALRDPNARDKSAKGCLDHVFHLHGLKNTQRVTSAYA